MSEQSSATCLTLADFQNQLSSALNSLKNLSSSERCEAVIYLKSCIDNLKDDIPNRNEEEKKYTTLVTAAATGEDVSDRESLYEGIYSNSQEQALDRVEELPCESMETEPCREDVESNCATVLVKPELDMMVDNSIDDNEDNASNEVNKQRKQKDVHEKILTNCRMKLRNRIVDKGEAENQGGTAIPSRRIKATKRVKLKEDEEIEEESKENTENNATEFAKVPKQEVDKDNVERMKLSLMMRCYGCDMEFQSQSALQDHLHEHKTDPASCDVCHKEFPNKDAYLNHFSSRSCIKSKKLTVLKKCNQCSESFRYRRHYDKHMEGHRRNNCKLCNKLFSVRKHLQIHMRESHKLKVVDTKYKCTFCEKWFVKRLSLYYHYRVHAGDKIVCLMCGHFSVTKEDDKRHQDDHEKKKPWKCDLCKETFFRRQQLLYHVQKHDKYKCLTCSESFSARIKLLEHQRDGHVIKGLEEFKCNKCDKSFERPSLLELHSRVHSGERPIACKECNKRFQTPKSYSKHLRSLTHHRNILGISEDGNDFTCEKCGLQFAEKSNLESHIRNKHGKGELYTCGFCEYQCSSKANMKRHKELHTEGRQFVCELCGAAFYALATLKDHHNYVHSDERKFVCGKCGKSFKGNNALTRHLLTHSDDRPYICHCGQPYKRMFHLKRHMESAHSTVFRTKKLLRLRPSITGDLIPVADDKPASVKEKKVKKDPNIIEQEQLADAIILNPVLSLSSGQVVALQQLSVSDLQLDEHNGTAGVNVSGTIDHAISANISVAASQGNSLPVSLPTNLPTVAGGDHGTQDIYHSKTLSPDVLHAIQVSYEDLNFPTTQGITVVSGSEPHLVFSSASPVTVSASTAEMINAELTLDHSGNIAISQIQGDHSSHHHAQATHPHLVDLEPILQTSLGASDLGLLKAADGNHSLTSKTVDLTILTSVSRSLSSATSTLPVSVLSGTPSSSHLSLPSAPSLSGSSCLNMGVHTPLPPASSIITIASSANSSPAPVTSLPLPEVNGNASVLNHSESSQLLVKLGCPSDSLLSTENHHESLLNPSTLAQFSSRLPSTTTTVSPASSSTPASMQPASQPSNQTLLPSLSGLGSEYLPHNFHFLNV